MKKLIAMLLATIMCMTVLVACGSEQVTSEGTVNNESSPVSEAGTGEAQGTTSGVLVVGTNAEFPPFEYLGEDGQPDGFDIALIKAVAEKLNMEVEIQNMEFNSLVAAIGTKIDAAIAGMTILPERLEVVDFSEPYYEAVQHVIVPADSTIATIDDLKNKTIGVQLGTTGMTTAAQIEGATVQSYNKAVDAVNDLNNGRVDLVIIDRNPAQVFVSKFDGKIKSIEGAQFGFVPEEYAIALPKGSDMVEKVNQALAELKADGTFDELVAEYIGEAQ